MATPRLKGLNSLLIEPEMGTPIHYDIGETFKLRNYPNVCVEYLIDSTGGGELIAGRIIPLAWTYIVYPNRMVCVTDDRTGKRGLSATRALLPARIARVHFPDAKGVVIIQVRPN